MGERSSLNNVDPVAPLMSPSSPRRRACAHTTTRSLDLRPDGHLPHNRHKAFNPGSVHWPGRLTTPSDGAGGAPQPPPLHHCWVQVRARSAPPPRAHKQPATPSHRRTGGLHPQHSATAMAAQPGKSLASIPTRRLDLRWSAAAVSLSRWANSSLDNSGDLHSTVTNHWSPELRPSFPSSANRHSHNT